MAYDWEAYQADRTTMGFEPLVRLFPETVSRKRKRLAIDGDGKDQAAIDAACGRLLAWMASGEPEPAPPPSPRSRKTTAAKPASMFPKSISEVERAARVRMLADQQDRHQNRRREWPAVRPTPGA